MNERLPCRRTEARRCGALVARRARAGRPILGRWTPGEVLKQAQQAVEDGLPGGGVGVTNLGGGLLHSSCWCARHACCHCVRCIVLSLPYVCAASLSRAATIDDLGQQPDRLPASLAAVLSAVLESCAPELGSAFCMPSGRARCPHVACSAPRRLAASGARSG